MKKLILLLSVLLFSLEFVVAQDEYERSVFVSSSGDSLNYRLLEPEVMQAGEKYPLVLFLHGAGERGNDNEKQLTHGGQMFLNPVNREKYPAFVLFPQWILGIRKPSAVFYSHPDASRKRNAICVSGCERIARYVFGKSSGR